MRDATMGLVEEEPCSSQCWAVHVFMIYLGSPGPQPTPEHPGPPKRTRGGCERNVCVCGPYCTALLGRLACCLRRFAAIESMQECVLTARVAMERSRREKGDGNSARRSCLQYVQARVRSMVGDSAVGKELHPCTLHPAPALHTGCCLFIAPVFNHCNLQPQSSAPSLSVFGVGSPLLLGCAC